jgi:hypothetical protein
MEAGSDRTPVKMESVTDVGSAMGSRISSHRTLTAEWPIMSSKRVFSMTQSLASRGDIFRLRDGCVVDPDDDDSEEDREVAEAIGSTGTL